jgi:hypothetical protein
MNKLSKISKMSSMSKKTVNNILTIENIFGVILAICILFQITPDREFANKLNTSVGIITSLILAVILFTTMNPIVGFLFLIFVYQILQKASNTVMNKQTELMKRMNQPLDTELEESVIDKMAPIKNKYRDSVVSFEPVLTA